MNRRWKKTAISKKTVKPWQFKKGKSGNPSGRPKEDFSIRDMARKNTPEAWEMILETMRGDEPDLALKAAMAVIERGWGKPIQPIEGELNQTVIMEAIEIDGKKLEFNLE